MCFSFSSTTSLSVIVKCQRAILNQQHITNQCHMAPGALGNISVSAQRCSVFSDVDRTRRAVAETDAARRSVYKTSRPEMLGWTEDWVIWRRWRLQSFYWSLLLCPAARWPVSVCDFIVAYCSFLHVYLSYFTNPASWLEINACLVLSCLGVYNVVQKAASAHIFAFVFETPWPSNNSFVFSTGFPIITAMYFVINGISVAVIYTFVQE